MADQNTAPKQTENAPKKITKTTLRTYQVGFGDCFLLIFKYSDGSEKFMLFDFGTTGLPDHFPEDQMLRVARNIHQRCNGKLDAVVATHRHKDHISGFSTEGVKDEVLKKSSGDIIALCKPDLIIQPWTENPALADKAHDTVNLVNPQILIEENEKKDNFQQKSFGMMLQNMHNVAETIALEGERLGKSAGDNGANGGGFVQPIDKKKKDLLKTMGDNNAVPNRSAVENLRKMGEKTQRKFVNYGSDLEVLEKMLGIKVHVLGPPTIQQYDKILKQRSRDDNEFWMLTASLRNYWKLQSATANLTEEQLDKNNRMPDNPFPQAKVYDRYAPSHTRWFIRRMRNVRADQLLGIVRILDKAMNNTSVILLLEVGDKKLLFPGDAQIENWEYVLKFERSNKNNEDERQKYLALLRDTTLYKVGHHGSRNATPKTLWNNFKYKTPNDIAEDKKKPFVSVVSTMEGKHGETEETKVPRQTLVDELSKHSQYRTTQDINTDYKDEDKIPDSEKGLYFDIEL